MAKLELRGVSKSFGATRVLRDVSLHAEHGEFLTLLGPSGCGKSTLLRIIAGLEPQDAGSVRIGGQAVDDWRPKDRDVAMVFQSYALYPHLTVAANLALPLQMRRLSAAQRLPLIGPLLPGSRSIRATIEREVREMAQSLELGALLERKPGQLSGGQRQRVALARAMVRHPALFLMDEPLSNLDSKLRMQMRTEIAALRRRVDATFVYVTHDQTEAMTMSDRVAVMFEGEVVQVGSPQVLYERPATRRVARFIGSPRINLLEGVVQPNRRVAAAGCELQVNCDVAAGTSVTVGLRPEALQVVESAGSGVLSGRIQQVEYLGSDLLVYFNVVGGSEPLVLRTPPQQSHSMRPGAPIHVTARREGVLLFDAQGDAISAPPVIQLSSHGSP